jgi:hypothetical protein
MFRLFVSHARVMRGGGGDSERPTCDPDILDGESLSIGLSR